MTLADIKVRSKFELGLAAMIYKEKVIELLIKSTSARREAIWCRKHRSGIGNSFKKQWDLPFTAEQVKSIYCSNHKAGGIHFNLKDKTSWYVRPFQPAKSSYNNWYETPHDPKSAQEANAATERFKETVSQLRGFEKIEEPFNKAFNDFCTKARKNGELPNVRRRLLKSEPVFRRRCDSPVLLRLLNEIRVANGLEPLRYRYANSETDALP